MKLLDQEPFFIRWDKESDGTYVLPHAETLADAQGIVFICFCQKHSVLISVRDRGVPDDAPGPKPRWAVSGTGFEDLTLSPSINLDVGSPDRTCRWHGWIQNGEVT